ncbi:hypothetical protein [Gaopeijia maritima]|uniref:N-acetylmuramoyl-L-alanine amidase n=1 Tax=Gaopeijia maritima TaxID=3119007 RepID=A0ABU9E9Y6_9BACT
MTTKNGRGRSEECTGREPVPGIVIHRGANGVGPVDPRISAFIWGGKVRPTPTLPYGRRQGAA